MLTLNLSDTLKALDGTPSDVTMANALANWLSQGSDEDYKKWMTIARELLNTQKVEIQRRDLIDLETKINKSDLRNIFKEQILDAIDKTLNQKEGE